MGYLELTLIFLCAVGVAGQVDPWICDPQCVNGGTCNESTCICPHPYHGEYCQIEPPDDDSTTYETVTLDVTTDESTPGTPMVPTPPPPSPPAPSIFPSKKPTTTAAPTQPTTTRMPTPTRTEPPMTPTPPSEPTPMIPTPPPLPPPSPSLFVPQPGSSTPKPRTEQPMTTRMTTRYMTTRHMTTKMATRPMEPLPELIDIGGVIVTLEYPPEEFNPEEEMKFKNVIAKNVNDYCAVEGNCRVAGKNVVGNDVITYEIRGVSVPEMAAILNMEGTDTVVEFYVTYGDGTDVVLDKEQLDTMLVENGDEITDDLGYGFQRGAPEPVTGELALDWWIILLICVGGALVLIIMGFGLYRNTKVDEAKGKSLDSDSGSDDVEMQGKVTSNGGINQTTQASQSEIVKETRYVFTNHYTVEPTKDTDTGTQVTAPEIMKETGFDAENNNTTKTSLDSGSKPITKALLEPETEPKPTTDEAEVPNGNAVTVKAQVETPEPEPQPENVTTATLGDDLPPPPPELLRMSSTEEAAVGELDKLVQDHNTGSGDKSDNTFENPAYKADEDGQPRTEL